MHIIIDTSGFEPYGPAVEFYTAYCGGEKRRIQFLWNDALKEMVARVERCVSGKWEEYCSVDQEHITVEVDSRAERSRIISEAATNRTPPKMHPDRKFSEMKGSPFKKRMYVDMLSNESVEHLVPQLTMVPAGAGKSGGSLETITAIRLVHPPE